MDVMLLIMILHTIYAYDIKCPEAGEWNIRAKSNCKTLQQYVCLRSNDDDYIESCIGVGLAMPGTKYTINTGNFDKKNCSLERYQPFIFSTIGNSNCAYHKSTCNAIGLFIHNNGFIDNDRMCSCDYTQGYAFVTPPKNTCYCIPSQEDCSCYLKSCDDKQILSSDYECVQKTNIQYQAPRCFTTMLKSIKPKMEELVIIDSDVISGMMHNTVECIVVISIAILILLPIAVGLLRDHPFSWKNVPTMLIWANNTQRTTMADRNEKHRTTMLDNSEPTNTVGNIAMNTLEQDSKTKISQSGGINNIQTELKIEIPASSLNAIENETIKGSDFLHGEKYNKPAKAGLNANEKEIIDEHVFFLAEENIKPAKESNFNTNNDSIMDIDKAHGESNEQKARNAKPDATVIDTAKAIITEDGISSAETKEYDSETKAFPGQSSHYLHTETKAKIPPPHVEGNFGNSEQVQSFASKDGMSTNSIEDDDIQNFEQTDRYDVDGFARIRLSDKNGRVHKKVYEVKTTPSSSYYEPDVPDDKETATIATASLIPTPSKGDKKLKKGLAIQHTIAVNTETVTEQPAEIRQPSYTLADTSRPEVAVEISESQMTETEEITNTVANTTHPQHTEAYTSNSVFTYVAPSEPNVPYTVQHSPACAETVVVSSQQSLYVLKQGQYAATSEDDSQNKRTVSYCVPTDPLVNKTATVPKDNALEGEPTSDENCCNVATEITPLPEGMINEDSTVAVSNEAINVATNVSDNISTSFKRTEDQLREAENAHYSPPTKSTDCTKENVTTGSAETTQTVPENGQSATLTGSTDITTQNLKGPDKTGNTGAIDPFEKLIIDIDLEKLDNTDEKREESKEIK